MQQHRDRTFPVVLTAFASLGVAEITSSIPGASCHSSTEQVPWQPWAGTDGSPSQLPVHWEHLFQVLGFVVLYFALTLFGAGCVDNRIRCLVIKISTRGQEEGEITRELLNSESLDSSASEKNPIITVEDTHIS